MSGHLRRYARPAYCTHTTPPDPKTIGAQEHDVWECDQCTANWVIIHGTNRELVWLRDPIYPQRRTWLDRRRRAATRRTGDDTPL